MTGKKQGPGARSRAEPPHTPQDATRHDQAGAATPETPPGSMGAVAAPIPTFAPSRGLMTPLQSRFAQEYVVDLNATQAYHRTRAPVRFTDETASTEGYKLLRSPEVGAEVQRLMDERAMRTGITADRVLLHAWSVAMADARELTELLIGSCRHCWGLYNQYQYTETELELARDKHMREAKKKAQAEKQPFDPDAVVFHERGGPGYDPNKPPNPECPECWGDGVSRPVIHDTRHLSPGAAALYDGIAIKRGKEGMTVNVKTQDRSPYLMLVARHLGMLNDKLMKPEEVDNPLLALLKQIQSSHASSLPIVRTDPEHRATLAPRADNEPTDVVARPAPAPRSGWTRAKTK